jgi:hypothetical protein
MLFKTHMRNDLLGVNATPTFYYTSARIVSKFSINPSSCLFLEKYSYSLKTPFCQISIINVTIVVVYMRQTRQCPTRVGTSVVLKI